MKCKLSEIFEKPISGEWGNELKEGENGTKVIRTTNFTNTGILNLVDVVERKIDIEKHKNKLLKSGDIIIEKSGGSPNQPVGRVVIFENNNNEKYFCNNFTSVLRPKKILYGKYALYMMKDLYNKKTVLKFQNKTTGIINLKLNDYLNNVNVEIPDLKIQEKIIEVLDKSQELINKRKTQIEALDELVKSQFIEMFGDPIINSKKLPMKPLGEICNMKAGKSIKAKDIYEVRHEGMYPCYGGNGLRGYTEMYTHEGKIPLIGRQGALCGNVQYTEGKFYATEHAIVTQPKVQINTCWLYIMLREMNLNRLASGAAQPGLNVSTLIPMKVIFPPIELQNQFADFVKQVDKLKFEMENSLKELEDNFNSLMQRAFKGELFS